MDQDKLLCILRYDSVVLLHGGGHLEVAGKRSWRLAAT